MSMKLCARNHLILLFYLLHIFSLFSDSFVSYSYTKQYGYACSSQTSCLHQNDIKLTNSLSTTNDGRQNDQQVKQQAKRERPRIPVLQYHDNWVAINKPAGISTTRSKSTPRSHFVLSTLLKRQLARKIYPVHRLDHRTSGAMLFAFDSRTCGLLHNALTFAGCVDDDNDDDCDFLVDKKIKSVANSDGSSKQYIALLRGDWKRKFGDMNSITVRKPLNVKGTEKEAETIFTVLASHSGDPNSNHCLSACSLVLCSPKTGRFHQIRRHAQSISFPVIGDNKYGDTKVNRFFREERSLNRLFLHCFILRLPPLSTFDTESSDDSIEIIAPLSQDLQDALQREEMRLLLQEALKIEPRLLLEQVDERGGTFGRNYSSGKNEDI